MTTDERLRAAALELKRQRPRPQFGGEYLDELLQRGADELRELHSSFGSLALLHYGNP